MIEKKDQLETSKLETMRLNEERKLSPKEIEARAMAKKVKTKARDEHTQIMMMDPSEMDAIAKYYWEMPDNDDGS
jgi:hypothetical protein